MMNVSGMLNVNNLKLTELKQANVKLKNTNDKLNIEINSLKRMLNAKLQSFDNIEDHKKREAAAQKTKRIVESNYSPETAFKRVVMKRNSRLKNIGSISYAPVNNNENVKDVYGSVRSGRLESKHNSVVVPPI